MLLHRKEQGEYIMRENGGEGEEKKISNCLSIYRLDWHTYIIKAIEF